MDDHDFVFVNKPLTAKEENEFSEFLKSLSQKQNPGKKCELHQVQRLNWLS